MKRLLSLSTAAALAAVAVAAGFAGSTPASAAPAAGTAGGAFVGIAPTRAVDTRLTGGALAPGETRVVDLSKVVTSTTATAVVLDLTVTDPTSDGFLTVWPDGTSRPGTSSLNKRYEETRSNSVTVALPAGGSRKVDVYNQLGSSQVIVDVDGWYDPAAVGTGAEYFDTVAPSRPYDSRPGVLGPGQRATVMQGNAFTSSHVVSAVAVTITAVDNSGPGYLTAWSGLGPQPNASTVNYGDENATPNFAVVPVVRHDDGSISFVVGANVARSVSVVVDVLGYYAAPDTNGLLFEPVTPVRVADTRADGRAFAADETRSFTLPSQVARPDGASAFAFNTTAVDDTVAATYLTVFNPSQNRPTISTLNTSSPFPVADATQLPIEGATEQTAFTVYNFAGSVDFVADLQGWFVSVPFDGGAS